MRTSARICRISAFVLSLGCVAAWAADRPRILVVSSYHPEYLWSQDTALGVNASLLDAGWLDDEAQGRAFMRDDAVESSRVSLRKVWMDTKRANRRQDIASALARVVDAVERFDPHLLLLGDDNAAHYVGSHYLDTRLPMVFWGVNGLPTKYAFVERMDRPGHNITGVYQAGYLREGVQWLQKLLPEVTRLAVLADGSPTSRAKVKELERLARSGELPMTLVGSVVTNDYELWQSGALSLSDEADAFFVLNHNTLRDVHGEVVDQLEAGRWYLENIRKPDIGHERQFVVEGVLCAVDDSGFKQGYEAVRIARRILERGESPARIAIYAPERGEFVVNEARARMLGLADRLARSDLVESRVPTALALQQRR